jgi:alkanesulfonate monooxygenase SsuD/methylene tetrahydromethanopterin reductase-like flavin-dependent oxidoreductase (luciferase family)
VIASYRENFQPSDHQSEPHVILALAAIIADTEERAQELAQANALSMLRLRSGRPGPLPSPEEAAAYPWSDAERAAVEEWSGLVSVGTADQVAADLTRRAKSADADELIITTNIHSPTERRHSFTELAAAWGLKPR